MTTFLYLWDDCVCRLWAGHHVQRRVSAGEPSPRRRLQASTGDKSRPLVFNNCILTRPVPLRFISGCSTVKFHCEPCISRPNGSFWVRPCYKPVHPGLWMAKTWFLGLSELQFVFYYGYWPVRSWTYTFSLCLFALTYSLWRLNT